MISTRFVMPNDEQEIMSLFRMNARETHPHLGFEPVRAKRVFEDSILHAHPTIFVAVQNDSVIGYLAARLEEYAFTTGIFVSQEVLYVRPDKRGTRAAAKLIEEFLRWGEILQAREIIFGISNGRNVPQVEKLFKRFGAKTVGVHMRIIRNG